ncbi:DUF3368 domain-containing protein [Dactylococcopsis salina]|uniref:DUF3368 domain-containing protein n=1 Tax=Dactylococcopsis salina (strain PCC 8305) TaxID=13035 RepID=K9YPZ9_DACS8|nr:DUF3368 domain-containing protein [Dactylococcopsis salina]AFZ49006.1 protein of unknown function (DUF3368) [Dactylococcopsis salina PCC 8305]
MAEFPAINTSPLIFLTKGNYLSLLQVVSPTFIVPDVVARPILETLKQSGMYLSDHVINEALKMINE